MGNVQARRLLSSTRADLPVGPFGKKEKVICPDRKPVAANPVGRVVQLDAAIVVRDRRVIRAHV
jgi:hypothetical protein